MAAFFTRERFGRPQFFAGMLLVAFVAQAAWLIHSEGKFSEHGSGPLAGEVREAPEQLRLTAGWRQWHGGGIAGAPYPDPPEFLRGEAIQNGAGFDREHSPLPALITAAPLLLWAHASNGGEPSLAPMWLARFPFLACGALLGASLWYVARRLCGNAGGFLALTLYCFSPSMIQASAVWHTEPEILTVWGSFGAIFTSIAVAHTLYAPREVVLWNWRRIVLLGISLAIAVGSQFSMIVVLPLALVLLLYLAPIRRGAALVIGFAASVLAVVILFAAYFFHPGIFWQAMRHASFWAATWRSFTVLPVYREVVMQVLRACPAFLLLLPLAAATYAVWPRTRYFGNTAPLLVGLLFLGLGIAHPHVGGEGFLLTSIPFLLIFVSGVIADLMETRYRPMVTAGVWALTGAYVVWSVLALSHVPRG